jgi:hypothetical protein
MILGVAKEKRKFPPLSVPPNKKYHSYYLPSESWLHPTTTLPYVYFYDLTSKKRDYTLIPHLYNKIISTKNSHQDSIPTTSPQFFFSLPHLQKMNSQYLPLKSELNPITFLQSQGLMTLPRPEFDVDSHCLTRGPIMLYFD